MVAEHGEHAEPRAQLAEPPGDRLGGDGRAEMDLGVDVVAEQQDEVGPAAVDRLDDARHALLADVRRAGMEVGDDRDAQPGERRRPVREAQGARPEAAVARLVPQRAPAERRGGEGCGGGRRDRERPGATRHAGSLPGVRARQPAAG